MNGNGNVIHRSFDCITPDKPIEWRRTFCVYFALNTHTLVVYTQCNILVQIVQSWHILTDNKYILLNDPRRMSGNLALVRSCRHIYYLFILDHTCWYVWLSLNSRMAHSNVPSSSFTTDSIFSFQLFGYWNSILYRLSPEYVCWPTVSNSRPLSPGFRRTHDTYNMICSRANQITKEMLFNQFHVEIQMKKNIHTHNTQNTSKSTVHKHIEHAQYVYIQNTNIRR